MNQKIIGITGGIGSGKSIICKIFATMNIPIYDADSRAKYLINNELPLKKSIKTEFDLGFIIISLKNTKAK